MVKLLIVDDEIQIRTGIRDSINWKELEIQVCGLAGCVSDALDMIELQAPDIIIIDICMPQISGLELLEITHDQYPNIRVILISGYREFENARAAVNLNAFAFIAKPIDIEELCAVLCRARDEIQSHRDMLQKEATIAAK
ncbi:MAG: response regulator [Clostridia bacterium]